MVGAAACCNRRGARRSELQPSGVQGAGSRLNAAGRRRMAGPPPPLRGAAAGPAVNAQLPAAARAAAPQRQPCCTPMGARRPLGVTHRSVSPHRSFQEAEAGTAGPLGPACCGAAHRPLCMQAPPSADGVGALLKALNLSWRPHRQPLGTGLGRAATPLPQLPPTGRALSSGASTLSLLACADELVQQLRKTNTLSKQNFGGIQGSKWIAGSRGTKETPRWGRKAGQVPMTSRHDGYNRCSCLD